eukprot:8348901-Karenia_brevis.AAC.1
MSLIKSATSASVIFCAVLKKGMLFANIRPHLEELYSSQILVVGYNGLEKEEILRYRPCLYADAEGIAAS